MKESKYCLALMLPKGRIALINIADLDISNHYLPQSLEEIDAFTMHFTEKEIKEAIKKANTASGFIDGTLCLVDVFYKKNIPMQVLTKDFLNDFNIGQYIMSILPNKNLLNNFVNKYIALTNNEELKILIKEAVKEQDVTKIIDLFNKLEYLAKRELIAYLIVHKIEQNKKENPKLKLDKAA